MSPVQKILQKQLYNFVGSNWGMVVIVLGFFWCLNSILQLLQIALSGPIASPTCVHCCQHNYADNLAESTFEGRLCLPQVDVVYTWVNGSDERLQAEVAYWKPIFLRENGLPSEDEGYNISFAAPVVSNQTSQDEHTEKNQITDGKNRFRDNQELRYSLRSIWKYAPWVRHVYILTNGQIPYWLNTDHPRLTMVTHADVIKNEYLPTFSSPAIETGLHKIPGIANYFIYFNDDVMLGNSIWPDDFYTHAHGQKVFLSWAVPNCAPGCPDTWQGDKYCDAACNNADCNWDGGDCLNHTGAPGTGGSITNRWSGNTYSSGSTTQDYCASGCPNNWLGDKVCDRSCKNFACAFDAGDCGVEDLHSSVPGFFLDADMEEIAISREMNSFYVNISAIFGENVLEASHTNGPLVRAAVITKNTGVLTVLLYPYPTPAPTAASNESLISIPSTLSLPAQSINFVISGTVNGQITEAEFNVTRHGYVFEINSTLPTGISGVRLSTHGPPPTTGAPTSLPPTAAAASLSSSSNISNTSTTSTTTNNTTATASTSIHNNTLLDGFAPEEEGEGGEEAVVVTTDRVVLRNGSQHTEGVGAPRARRRKKSHMRRGEEASSSGARRLLELELPEDLLRDPEDIAESVVVESLVDEEGERVFVKDYNWEQIERADEATVQKRKQLLMHSIVNANEYRDTLLELLEEEFGEVFPWELEDKLKGLETMSSSRRLLVDTFADSLRWVNSLYNKVFGKDNRKVPAHMPHFIDRRIQEELYARWPDRFDQTASHRFRHSNDMQFAFSYFYFMMQSKQVYDSKKVFAQLDGDEDGVLSQNEVEYLTMVMNSENGEKFKLEDVYSALINTSLSSPLGSLSPYAEKITYEVFMAVPDIQRKLRMIVEKKPKYLHQEMGSEEIEFYMVGNDVEKVTTRLQELRTKAPKFICLNDDMNKTHDPDPQLLVELHKFYTGYFPKACPFELPDGVHNEFRYVEDMRAVQRRTTASWVLVLFVIVGLVVVWMYPRQMKAFFQSAGAPIYEACCEAKRRRGERFVTV